jgi:hypothetical protein
LELSHDLPQLTKNERATIARTKIIPKLLSLLLEEFSFPSELLKNRFKAGWILIAGLNFSNLILKWTKMSPPSKDLMLGLVSRDLCLRIHYLILLALDVVLMKMRGYESLFQPHATD